MKTQGISKLSGKYRKEIPFTTNHRLDGVFFKPCFMNGRTHLPFPQLVPFPASAVSPSSFTKSLDPGSRLRVSVETFPETFPGPLEGQCFCSRLGLVPSFSVESLVNFRHFSKISSSFTFIKWKVWCISRSEIQISSSFTFTVPTLWLDIGL